MAKTKTTQCMRIEVTFINEVRTPEEIKKLLGADDVVVKSNKIFDHTQPVKATVKKVKKAK